MILYSRVEKENFMKKILFLFTFMTLFSCVVNAASYDAAARVETIANNLLVKNSIPVSNIKFEVTDKAVDNSTFVDDRVVSISKDDLKYAGNDNEVAAVVANELGHIITGHASKDRFVSSFVGETTSATGVTGELINNYKFTKEEKEADVVAVNLMANAGYNPLAAIVVLTKQTSTYWDMLKAQPANAERAMNIFDYANYAYPNSVKSGYSCIEYKNFLTYANTVIEKRNADSKAQEKLNKELQKYRKNSVSQISKFRTRGGLSFWDVLFGIFK